ncbi:MAG: hypothetical protein WCT49_06080 [Candidatus Paceibacterota bacterium]|jgi:uncharacterized membrane protein YphA (DoxX/SURF4 family)|nr:hypothetical protein [Candidatus Paceibacterota bacterium]
MLSLFPQLFGFAFPATGVLRVVVSIIFMIEGKRNFSNKPFIDTNPRVSYVKKTQAIIEVIGGSMLFIGLFVQPVSIILCLSLLIRMLFEHDIQSSDKRVCYYYLLLFVLTISFLFLGPGMYALDFPL